MSEHKEPIPSMIYNAAVGGHVTNSQQIIDEDYNLEQKDINKETLGVPYNASTPNGMGKIVLKKNDNFKQVVEAQTDGNTIFVIKYDYTLTGNVTVPANCILEFDGGSIDGGGTAGLGNGHTVTFNNTVVTKQKNAFTNCRFAGSLATQQVFMSTFGVVADGLTDDSWVIQDVIDCAYGKSSEVFFDCDGDYLICTTSHHTVIRFMSDTVYTFTGKGFIKQNSDRNAFTATGTITVCHHSENIVINNIRVDGNFVNSGGSGQNGLSVARTKNVTIRGGIIKNCNRGDMVLQGSSVYKGDGGKGIQTENCGNQNLLIDGVSFYDCSMAISMRTSYKSEEQEEFEPQIIHATNIYAENCPIFLYCGLVNAIDLDANLLNLVIDNSVIKNCGWFKYGVTDGHHPDDYTGLDPENPDHSEWLDEGGVFVLDRATNLKLNNICVVGTKTAYNIFTGSHRHCSFDNIVINQTCTSVMCLDRGVYNQDYHVCCDNYYKLVVDCTYTYLFYNILPNKSSFSNVTIEIILMNIIKDVVVIPAASFGNLTHGYKCNLKLFPVYKGDGQGNTLHPLDSFNGELSHFISAPVNAVVNNLHKRFIGTYSDKPYYNYFGAPYLVENGERTIPIWKSKTTPGDYYEADGNYASIVRSGSTAVRQQQLSVPKRDGFVYFDTDINKPCFWNGTKYVLADGTDAPTT